MLTEFVKTREDVINALRLVAGMMTESSGKLFRFRFDLYDEKTREQEKKYHAMLGDVARQARHLNEVLSSDDWKRLCVKKFADDCIENNVDRLADYWRKQNFRLMPGLGGRSLVALGGQTRDFPKYVAAGFIEWLHHYGAENEIVWSDPKYRDEYERMAA